MRSSSSTTSASGAASSSTSALKRIRDESPLLILPVLEGSYPPAGQPRLFHVTAFRDWTAAVREQVENACERAGVRYQIGYDRMTPEILHSIWTDICQASFIVADITGFNPNALFELAMAHALGRPSLMMTQDRDAHAQLPALRKMRTHHYEAVNSSRKLAALLDRFLAGSE
jgi:hypothetical protein